MGNEKLLNIISETSDKAKLENWVANAERKGAPDVVDAARRRLVELGAHDGVGDPNDALALDFWRSIIALESVLSNERGKTTRLSRTRQKIGRVGEERTLIDLILETKPSQGYDLLRERRMLDLTAEAVALRFPDRFEEGVLAAARRRLENEGIGPEPSAP